MDELRPMLDNSVPVHLLREDAATHAIARFQDHDPQPTFCKRPRCPQPRRSRPDHDYVNFLHLHPTCFSVERFAARPDSR